MLRAHASFVSEKILPSAISSNALIAIFRFRASVADAGIFGSIFTSTGSNWPRELGVITKTTA